MGELVSCSCLASNRTLEYLMVLGSRGKISFHSLFQPLLLACRSVMDGSSRNSSSMAVKMLSRGARGPTGLGQTIVVNVPYIRSDIPILVLFRALGFVADKDILEHIVYNFEDVEMMEALRPSIEEAFPVQDQNVSLILDDHL